MALLEGLVAFTLLGCVLLLVYAYANIRSAEDREEIERLGEDLW